MRGWFIASPGTNGRPLTPPASYWYQRPGAGNEPEPGQRRPGLPPAGSGACGGRAAGPGAAGCRVDATFGGGGHTRRLLDEFGESVTVVAIDRDPAALANAREFGVLAVQGNFTDLDDLVASVTGARCPVSCSTSGSPHISSTSRIGASRTATTGRSTCGWAPMPPTRQPRWSTNGPRTVSPTSSDVLGGAPGGVAARAIVDGRPHESTGQLSTVVAAVIPAAPSSGSSRPTDLPGDPDCGQW